MSSGMDDWQTIVDDVRSVTVRRAISEIDAKTTMHDRFPSKI